jgi:cell division protein FtsN
MAGRARQGGGGSRTGTLLVLAGIAGILTVTFVAGLWTGRHWPLLWGESKPVPAPTAPAESFAGRRGASERPKQAEPLPALTFYQELTAPLTAPPPPPKPRPSRPAEVKREPEKTDAAAAPAPAVQLPAPATQRGEAEAGGQFTVQVGAYNVRTPAETLRTTLVAAGLDARVVEAETSNGVRYRVQVGSFPTRDAARQVAVRLTAERSLPAFVAPR